MPVSGNVFTSQQGNEQGNSLAVTPEMDGVFIVGIKNDSTLIMEADLAGQVAWSRTFDVIPSAAEFPTTILVDDEGMLVVAGVGGDIAVGGRVYVIRYDPNLQQVLWCKEYPDGPTNFSYNIIQNGNGNYLLNTNPHDYPNVHNEADLFEINKNSGAVVAAFAVKYSFFGTETLAEIIYHNGFIYGTGRYKDGGLVTDFRHVVVKLDAANGDQIWSRFGHVPEDVDARLYGNQIIIHNDEIITGYTGDPDGSSVANNELYVQKTSLDGNLVWLYRYVLPGQTLICHDVMYSDNGILVLASGRTPSQEMALFKIDNDGAVLWAKRFSFPNISGFEMSPRGSNRLIEIDNNIMFVATGNAAGNKDIVLVRTDLNGNIDMPCIKSEPINLPRQTIINPSFYVVNPNATFDAPVAVTRNTTQRDAFILPQDACFVPDTIFTVIDTSICLGESYENYTEEGTYIDEYISIDGCDSIRTLNLDFLPGLETFVNAVVCEGMVVNGYAETGFYVDTFTAVSGCDSLSILDLTVHDTVMRSISHQICNGDAYLGYTTSGVYVDTFQTYQGCDSIVELTLGVFDEITEMLNETICLGDSYNGYNQGGTYRDTTLTVFGCDSIVILELTVLAEEKNISVSVCEGDFFENYTLPGTYIDTLRGIDSPCDTIRHLTLSVNALVTSNVSGIICEGDHYEGYTLPGIYTDTLLSTAGCDSVRTLSLSFKPASFSQTTIPFCDGITSGHTQPGTYVDTLVSQNGCDSIITLTLQAEPMYIPNVITPNGDGFNDEFRIFTPGDKPLDLAYFGIFDRFGDMVYETFTWPVVWDGRDNKDDPFNPGVFTFVLSYHCNQLRLTETGNVTLIR